jgi:hypothetical protein
LVVVFGNDNRTSANRFSPRSLPNIALPRKQPTAPMM